MRREAIWEYLRGALWALPSLAVVLALLAGSLLTLVEVSPDSTFGHLLFQGTADDARTLLISIASTMATVIALVLGLSVVALQLSSTQFSPRLLRNFLRDRHNQVVISVFVATFAYSTAGLYTVGISQGTRTEDYARLAVTGALLLHTFDVRAQSGAQAMPRDRKPSAPAPAGLNDEEAKLQQALAANPANVPP